MNYLRTAILLAAMTGLFLAVGYMLGGEGGMLIALVVAVGMNAFAYWNSDKVVLRMYGAREVDRNSAPALYGIVQQLAVNAELPMPKVYVIDNDQPNAFATGRNPENAAVAARLPGRSEAPTMAIERVRSRIALRSSALGSTYGIGPVCPMPCFVRISRRRTTS